MKPFHENLVAAWQDYAAGKIDAKALKGASAGFGIYQQWDDLTMMRIRRTGGFTSLEDLTKIAALLRKYNAAFVHLTTRQDYQLHGIRAADIPMALEDCEKVGFAFRGGGGDTFRNVLANVWMGFRHDSIFDVRPFIHALSKAFYAFDMAYALPRKLKIGFADSPANRLMAATQDLGFVATRDVNGNPAFEVWFAGGMGFKPCVGIKLYENLPAKDCIRVAFALTRLFNEKGCRTNRAHARIRFLREDLGDEKLTVLLKDYSAREVDTPEFEVPHVAHHVIPTTFPENECPSEGFEAWRNFAITPLKSGNFGVRLFVPFGNLTAAHVEALGAVLKLGGVTELQLSPTQDILIPEVPEAQLPALYNRLITDLRDVDYTVRSFKGHIPTCIGNAICKIGAADTPTLGAKLTAAFDAYLPADTPQKQLLAKRLLNDVRISGCPNSCAAHPAARFGFVCRKVDGVECLVPFTPAQNDPPALGVMQSQPLTIEACAKFLASEPQ